MGKMLTPLLLLLSIVTNNANRDIDIEDLKVSKVEGSKGVEIDHFKRRREQIIEAIALQESSGDSTQWNEIEDAVGYLQIRKVMVREVNRLTNSNYTYNDRWSKQKSIELFIKYNEVVNPEWDLERACRLWNGGISGMRKESTKKYFKEVEQKFAGLNNNS